MRPGKSRAAATATATAAVAVAGRREAQATQSHTLWKRYSRVRLPGNLLRESSPRDTCAPRSPPPGSGKTGNVVSVRECACVWEGGRRGEGDWMVRRDRVRVCAKRRDTRDTSPTVLTEETRDPGDRLIAARSSGRISVARAKMREPYSISAGTFIAALLSRARGPRRVIDKRVHLLSRLIKFGKGVAYRQARR